MENNKKLNEADLKNDAVKSVKARNIVQYCNDQIKAYEKNNNVIKKYKNGYFDEVKINFEDFKIFFTTGPSLGGAKARFFADTKTIVLYNCSVETKDNNKISVKFDDDDLYHELIHYFDMKDIPLDRVKQQKDSVDKSAETKGFHAAYYNDPLEVNAHFMQHVLPKMLGYLEKKDTLPKSFTEFRNAIVNEYSFKAWYDELDDNNKRRILKRLGQYWTEVVSNPDLGLEDPNHKIDNSKLEKMTYSFWNKVKDVVWTEEKRREQLKAIIKEIVREQLSSRNVL
jgi:hypothetical protein